MIVLCVINDTNVSFFCFMSFVVIFWFSFFLFCLLLLIACWYYGAWEMEYSDIKMRYGIVMQNKDMKIFMILFIINERL